MNALAQAARGRALVFAVLFAALLDCSGCAGCGTDDPLQPGREYVKDMIDSAPYDAFAPNSVMRDGKTLQAPVLGSVSRDIAPFDYTASPDDAARAGRELSTPLAMTPENLVRGDEVFHTVCYVCHGAQGRGDGPVVPRFPQPPSLVAAHAKQLRDGQIFHIITRGQGLMPSHAAQVRPEDRWRVIQYIRSLQASAGGAP